MVGCPVWPDASKADDSHVFVGNYPVLAIPKLVVLLLLQDNASITIYGVVSPENFQAVQLETSERWRYRAKMAQNGRQVDVLDVRVPVCQPNVPRRVKSVVLAYRLIQHFRSSTIEDGVVRVMFGGSRRMRPDVT
jgi:hypothetical protein